MLVRYHSNNILLFNQYIYVVSNFLHYNRAVCLIKYKNFKMCDQDLRYKEKLNTSDLYKTLNIPKRFDAPDMFYGYGIQREPENPVYKTTASEYGWYTPTSHTVPHRFFPRSHRFSTHLYKCGMYRNYSLNTVLDRSYV